MRYLYTGLGILLACLILCAAVTVALDRCMAEAAAQMEQARLLGEAGAYKQAARWIEEAAEGWERRMGFFGIVLPHDQLDQVDGAFRKAQAYAQKKNDGEFGPACIELIETLRSLADMAKPRYYNVL